MRRRFFFILMEKHKSDAEYRNAVSFKMMRRTYLIGYHFYSVSNDINFNCIYYLNSYK